MAIIKNKLVMRSLALLGCIGLGGILVFAGLARNSGIKTVAAESSSAMVGTLTLTDTNLLSTVSKALYDKADIVVRPEEYSTNVYDLYKIQ